MIRIACLFAAALAAGCASSPSAPRPGPIDYGIVCRELEASGQASRALRSSNRYFINQTSGAVHASLHAVAKYETANGAPNFSVHNARMQGIC